MRIAYINYLFSSAVNDTNNELWARLYLHSDFNKNDYGETIFYKADGEILTAVHPRPGRLVVWNSSIPFIYKPPAMSYLQGQYTLTFKLSPDREKMEREQVKVEVRAWFSCNFSSRFFQAFTAPFSRKMNFHESISRSFSSSPKISQGWLTKH